MNEYIQQIKENCIFSKYTKWYISIIEKARIRSNSMVRKEVKEMLGYVEAHHIWPKSFCDNKEKVDSQNLVFLTFREHVLVHLLLSKMFDDSNKRLKMEHACGAFFRLRSSQRSEFEKLNSKTLELLKIKYSSGLSEKYSGDKNPNFGGKYTNIPEVREK